MGAEHITPTKQPEQAPRQLLGATQANAPESGPLLTACQKRNGHCQLQDKGLSDSPCSAEACRMAPEVPSITLMLPRLVTANIALRAGW